MRAVILATWIWAAAAGHVQAAPVAAAVVAFFGITGTVATIATFVIEMAVTAAISWGVNKLFGPKPPKGGAQSAQERQASVTSLTVGEVSRELIIGEVATGGSLAGAFNYGGEYGTDWLVRVIILADHRCDGLVGFYVNDTFVAFDADGVVAGYNGQLEVHFRDGAAGQTFPAALLTAWQTSPVHADLAPATASYTSQSYVVVAAKADAPDAQTPTWSGGLPQMLFRVKGKLCYDPRKDTTVGGSGSHRWDDPDTWEWTRNGPVCRYNWVRGVYALDQVDQPDQLLIGRGLSAYEAPPENVFACANLADELVDEGDGGTEARYCTDGVIRATDSYLSVEQLFETAMAGHIIQPQGGVEVEPGQAKTPVFEITDADLVVGAPLEFNEFGSDAQRVNTVIPRYVEPAQKWQDHAAPVQRSLDAVAIDGPREDTLAMSLVTRATQAQRVAQISLRQRMLERTAKIVLPPRFAEAEEGDWIQWTSARHTHDAPVIFRIVSFGTDQSWQSAWALEETSFDVYGFGGSPLPASGGHLPAIPPGALALTSVTATAIQKEGSTGALIPAIRMTWDTPVDAAISRIRVEVRELGHTQVSPTATEAVNEGVVDVTGGVGPNMDLQARLVPLGAPGRPIVPSAWFNVSTGDLVSSVALTTIGGLTSAELLAKVSGAVAQGDALTKAVLEVALRLIDERAEMVTATFHRGQKVRKLIVDDGEDFTDGDYSITRRLQVLGLWIDNGSALQLNDTLIKVSPSETLASYRTAVAATFTANAATAAAAVSSESTARAGADSAFASSLGSVASTVGGFSSSITTLQTAVNGISAQWMVVVDAPTGRASISAYAGGSGPSYILFDAAQIGFTNGVSDFFPFSISGGVARAHNLEVDTFAAASIVAGHISAGAITINGLAVGAATTTTYDEQAYGGTLTTSPATVFSTSHTTDVAGSAHVLMFNASSNNSGSDAIVILTLYRDATFLTQKSFRAHATSQDSGGFMAYDAPGAGSHTYTLTAEKASGGGSSCVLSVSNLLILEAHR